MKNCYSKEADLLETLSLMVPLPANLQERIKGELITQTFTKKHLLLRPGEIARRFYFIRRGFLRSYFIDGQGKERTNWFMGKGEIILSNYSFLTQRPSYEYVEVLQAAELQSISWHQLNAYYAEFKEGNIIGRIINQNHFLMSEETTFLLRNSSIRQRYEMLKARYPDIDQLVTQNHIASYLGISRETLSRLRRVKPKMSHESQNQSNLFEDNGGSG